MPRCAGPIPRLLAALAAALACTPSLTTAAPAAGAAATLRARHAALREQLEHSGFGARLYLESVERPHAPQGDIYAVVDYPIASVIGTVTSPARWCDALILHLNIKYCHAVAGGQGTALSVAIGRKYDQPLDEAFRVEFAFAVAATQPDYVAVSLEAGKGPLGTTNYRISLEAVALEPGRAFLHLRFSYQYGIEGRLAMDAYLATTGSGKVGFTTIDARDARLIGGLRGAVERNTMRYYLALDACLGALTAPEPQRLEQSLERWYDATERYPRQLHEVGRETYLAMKRREYARQQTLQ
jgi:hypothetical protein